MTNTDTNVIMTSKVERYRINDYVGPPIWGIRAYSPLAVGNRVWFEQSLSPGGVWYLIVDIVDGKLATSYEDSGEFCGFIR